jgi:hypothetical protein
MTDTRRRAKRAVSLVVPVSAFAAGLYVLVAKGALTIDLGVGRRVRPLGPLDVAIDAPRETVFDVIAAPYLGKTPRAMQNKIRVLEHGNDMVLAAHYTDVGPLTTLTVEVVTFERPERVRFRLVRGPVPHVTEEFVLTARADGGCDFVYTGEIGADLWSLGAWWTGIVAKRWEATVRQSVEQIKAEAERRAAVGRTVKP